MKKEKTKKKTDKKNKKKKNLNLMEVLLSDNTHVH